MSDIQVETSGQGALFRSFRLDCAALSAPRPGRRLNEDRYVFVAPGARAVEHAGIGYLFAVADGSSAGGRGGLAAETTAELLRTIPADPRTVSLRPDLLELKIYDAHECVREDSSGQSTATAVWIWEEQEPLRLCAGWAHVGDSRLYHRTDGQWLQLTTDHSRGRGLARAIGGSSGLVVEAGRADVEAGDWLVLVSDGVWKRACPARSHLIDDCNSASDAVRKLVGHARFNGSTDDATAVVVRAGR